LAKAPYALLAQTCVIRDEIGAARWRGLFDKRNQLRKHECFQQALIASRVKLRESGENAKAMPELSRSLSSSLPKAGLGRVSWQNKAKRNYARISRSPHRPQADDDPTGGEPAM
jgi:hypothetical protein